MNIETRRDSFGNCSDLCKAVEVVKDGRVCHKYYSFYTSLDRIQQMLTGKIPSIWLTRIDSNLFDDQIENKKYGSKADQRKIFIKCFSYGIGESAAMWGLYCPTTYKAIRVTVTEKAMESLLEKGISCYKVTARGLSREKCSVNKCFTDIIYAAVKQKEDDGERSNVLYWNGAFAKVPKLFNKRHCVVAAGRIKDIEWSFENEARLIVTTANSQKNDHVAVALPSEFIQGISFTLSPWANSDEEKFVRDNLIKWLYAAGRRDVSAEDKTVFRSSVLKGALAKWAEQRGLA